MPMTCFSPRRWMLGGCFLVLAGGLQAADGKTISMQGNGQGAIACMACHGVNGEGQPAAGFPRLAGLNADYITHQLKSFADETRQDATMKPVAQALSDDEMAAVSRYYSELPLPDAVVKAADDASDNALGEQLALKGRWDQQVPACVQCHGPQGVGVGEHFPPLAGQSETYLINELQAWQKGKRANDPLGLMKHVADSLDDDDIKAVASWFASQSAVLEEASDE